MSAVGWVWLVAGLAAGAAHSHALWTATQRQRSAALAPLRLLAVSVFLGVALYFNGLMAAAGWGLGFPSGALWRAWPRRRVS